MGWFKKRKGGEDSMARKPQMDEEEEMKMLKDKIKNLKKKNKKSKEEEDLDGEDFETEEEDEEEEKVEETENSEDKTEIMVVKKEEIPVQEVRKIKKEDGTVVTLMTTEEALSKILNGVEEN